MQDQERVPDMGHDQTWSSSLGWGTIDHPQRHDPYLSNPFTCLRQSLGLRCVHVTLELKVSLVPCAVRHWRGSSGFIGILEPRM
jgi:hypothetical protein